jgi:hypothetical protein
MLCVNCELSVCVSSRHLFPNECMCINGWDGWHGLILRLDYVGIYFII